MNQDLEKKLDIMINSLSMIEGHEPPYTENNLDNVCEKLDQIIELLKNKKNLG
jgi:hypothetical protein|nr:MAG TPA: protein of unknown function (DUF4083) [Caudoviricetes sp.]